VDEELSVSQEMTHWLPNGELLPVKLDVAQWLPEEEEEEQQQRQAEVAIQIEHPRALQALPGQMVSEVWLA
jgi:hypothetical protein